MVVLPRAVGAEFVGTFALVAVGCGALVADEHWGAIGPLGVAVAFGAVVAAMVACLGPVSGAHLNPAVTLALARRRLITPRAAFDYVVAQGAGATMAAGLLHFVAVPGSPLGATHVRAGLGVLPAVVVEAAAAATLVAVIMVVATGRVLPRWVPPLAIGGVIFVAALVAGPWTGASLNPARSFGPALVSGTFGGLWLYLVAPVVGGVVGGGLACRLLPPTRCCHVSAAAKAVGS